MEGLWSRFNPAINRAKKWIKEGKIGIPIHLCRILFLQVGC